MAQTEASTGPTGHDIFEILMREHADMLVAYLRSLTNNTAAVDDLFQESMIVAWRRIGDYDRERPFGPWLRGIARKLALAHYRREARLPTWCTSDVLDALEHRFDALSRHRGDTFRERVDRLLECIGRLPDGLRQVIEFAYARGLMLREIAVSLGLHEEAIKKRVQRARKLLLDCLMETEAAP